MTLLAAQLLDSAWATFAAVAAAPDSSGLSVQSPSWEPARTPYDHAAALVRSLLPHAYNYPVTDTAATDLIWAAMVEAFQVLSVETVSCVVDDFYDFQGLAVLAGQGTYTATADGAVGGWVFDEVTR